MNKKKERAKQGVREIDKCTLCNNKAQVKCKKCKTKICRDCLEEDNGFCYKCNVIEVKEVIKEGVIYESD